MWWLAAFGVAVNFPAFSPSRARQGAARAAAVCRVSHRGPVVAASQTKETIMIIGKFQNAENGRITGELDALLVGRVKLTFEPNTVQTETGCEVGAAWKKTSREGDKPYISVRLESPFLPKPINTALFPAKDGAARRAVVARDCARRQSIWAILPGPGDMPSVRDRAFAARERLRRRGQSLRYEASVTGHPPADARRVAGTGWLGRRMSRSPGPSGARSQARPQSAGQFWPRFAARCITPDKEHRPPHKCVANVNAMCAPSCTCQS
jgi:uncharacterized protein (DUF736 family)